MALSEPTLVSAHAASSPPGGFAQLLDEVAAKLDRGDARDREALRYFRNRYQRLLQGDEPTRLYEFERRIDRLTETQQPVFVGLATTVNPSRGQDGVLCALLINPTWWLYREIRLRLRSTDLVFANDGQIPPMRLLDGRDAQPAYLSYRCPRADLTQTTLWLELDLCDHRGEWHAYDSRFEIRLDFSSRASGNPGEGTAVGIGQHDRFWPEPPAVASNRVSGAWLLADGGDAGRRRCRPFSLHLAAGTGGRLGACRQPTYRHRTCARSRYLADAGLVAGCRSDPGAGPHRTGVAPVHDLRPSQFYRWHGIRRFHPGSGTGFGDFTLGFVPKYTRISRLHCVVCALGDQLTLMPASDRGYTYTGRNGRRLERGRWEMLETGDMLEVCDLYRLKLVLAWDRKWEQSSPAWDPQPPREKFGRYLLDLIDVLRKRDQQGGADELRIALRNRYLNLLRVQDRVAQLNGVGNPGALLYARFEREDRARQQIAHFYVPKWLSLGSSPEAGLRIDAEDVRPRHAELLFRDGMYWIQNLADPGTVRIGHHGLATNEVLALEAGDVLRIGTAQYGLARRSSRSKHIDLRSATRRIRKRHLGEEAAKIAGAAQPQRAAVLANDVADDRQPQAVTGTRLVDASSALLQRLQLVRRTTRSVILDPQP